MQRTNRPWRWLGLAAMIAGALMLGACSTEKPKSGQPAGKPAASKPTTPVEKPKTTEPAKPEETTPAKPVEPSTKEQPAPKEEPGTKEQPAPKEPAMPKESPTSTEPAAVKEPPAKEQPAPTEEEAVEKPLDLGEPVVDNLQELRRLDPKLPVWVDAKKKEVVLLGAVCRANYPLEFFLTTTIPDRRYESVVITPVRPSIVHAALLALGAKPGKPAQWDPQYVPPSGTEVEIFLRWKDKDGKPQQARAQDWIRDIKTKKSPTLNWVFVGSRFWKDDTTGQEVYLADHGDFITVLNLATALLDVPIKSVGEIESRTFEGFVEHLPPVDTPVTISLKPKLDEKAATPPESTTAPKVEGGAKTDQAPKPTEPEKPKTDPPPKPIANDPSVVE